MSNKFIIKDNKIEFLDSRFYKTENGDLLPSVTTILSAYPKDQFFYDWLKNTGNNSDIIRDKSAEIGSNVHSAIEKLLKGEEISYTSYTVEEWMLINKAFEFFSRYKFTDIKTESNFCSIELGYGGTIDFIGTYEGKTYLIDFKTSNAMSDTMFMQVEAYNQYAKCDHVAILHLKSQTRTEKDWQGKGWKLEFPDKDYLQIFKKVKEVFDFKSSDIKPQINNYQTTLKLN